MNAKSQNIGSRIRQHISIVDSGAEVILFGSRARGDERPDSDWDILVLTNYPVDVQVERKFRNELYDLEIETGEPLSLFVYSQEEWEGRQSVTPFYRSVSEEGIRL